MAPAWYRRLDETYRSLGLVARFLVLFVAIMTASTVGRMVPYDGTYRLAVQFAVMTAVMAAVLLVLVGGLALRRPRND
jgi:low affinity Fe/Cu permease